MSGTIASTLYHCRLVMAMRRTLLPALALVLGAATACASTSTGGTATPSTSTSTSVSATATATATAPSPTPTVTAAPHSPPARGPGAVVKAYYDAINAHHYRTAWNLGGKRFSPTYSAFVAAFAETAHDRLRILRVSGPTVTVSLAATQTSGAVKLYSGTYHVSDGVITGARMRQVGVSPPGGTPSRSPSVFVHPGAFCSPVGAIGVTDRGTPMVCSRKAGDDHARWRHR
ncbi:hypothetical protein [Streptomyces sediminimaris]|uniref:hypothetical protein n=1 Tax=Streptomyces sediminimaris TaxID=3383721 RepID=UPI00399B5601